MVSAKVLLTIGFALRASADTIKINVGQSGLTFTPDSVTAKQNDVLEFHFYGPQTHNVVAGDFDNACQVASTGGFYSGAVAVSSGESPNVFTVTVNGTDPIFFYCSEGRHCKSGMVGAVNPSTDQTLDSYKQAASSFSGTAGTPGAVFGGTFGSAGSASTTTTTAAGSSSTGGSSSSSTGGSDSSSTGGSGSSSTGSPTGSQTTTSTTTSATTTKTPNSGGRAEIGVGMLIGALAMAL